MGKIFGDMKNDNSGFTLVEILLALAVLAIVSIPLLSYFSDASKMNALSARKERANLVAQSIIEDFKAQDMKSIAEEYRGDPTGKRHQYKYSDYNPTPSATGGGVYAATEEFVPNTVANYETMNVLPYYFEWKDYDAGDAKFDVRIEVKEGMYQRRHADIASAGAYVSDWNMFSEYDVGTVESNLNAVIEEGVSDKVAAIASLSRVSGAVVTESNIKRTIRISVDRTPSDTMNVKAVFNYQLIGNPAVSHSAIRYDKELADLKGIYLFYYPLTTSGTTSQTDFIQLTTNIMETGTTTPIRLTEIYDVYLIGSKKDVDGNPVDLTNYILFEDESVASQAVYGGVYSRLKNNVTVRGATSAVPVDAIDAVPSSRLYTDYYNKLSDHKQRLLEITVDVYRAGHAGDPDYLLLKLNSVEDD